MSQDQCVDHHGHRQQASGEEQLLHDEGSVSDDLVHRHSIERLFPSHRALDPRPESVAVLPVDDALGEVMRRILEDRALSLGGLNVNGVAGLRPFGMER